MSSQELIATAKAMVADDKGLLAIDESTPTIGKRFEKVGILQTEENRRLYRELIVTTPGWVSLSVVLSFMMRLSVRPKKMALPLLKS